MNCYFHTESVSVAQCTNGCGKYLCKECASKRTPTICDECAEAIEIENQQINEQREQDAVQRSLAYAQIRETHSKTKKKWIIIYLLLLLIFSTIYYHMFTTQNPELAGAWIAHGLLLGLYIVHFDPRLTAKNFNYFQKTFHVIAFAIFGVPLISILGLYGWSKSYKYD